jgi:hypothetical protein
MGKAYHIIFSGVIWRFMVYGHTDRKSKAKKFIEGKKKYYFGTVIENNNTFTP